MITSTHSPRLAAIMGKNIVNVNFRDKKILAIEKMDVKEIISIIWAIIYHLPKIFLTPPAKTLLNNKE